jgi:hypothetical protein
MPLEILAPDAKLDYSFDWDSWLPDGVSVSTRQWTIEPAGPTLANETTAQVIVSGLTFGKIYRLRESVVLSNDLEDERSIWFRCEKGQ